MAKIALSAAPFKEGTGLLFGAVGMLTAILGEEILVGVGVAGAYFGLALMSSAIRVEGKAWYEHCWSEMGCLARILFAVGALAPVGLIAWLLWPSPYLVAYQFCYRHIPGELPDGRPGVARYEFAVRFLNGRENDPVWFDVTESSLSLGGRASAAGGKDPPIKVTDKTRKALFTQAVEFSPPIATPAVVEGQYRFLARYGRDPEGPFREKMEVSGPLSVSFSSSSKRAILGFGQYPGSDTRRVERECHIEIRDKQ